MRDFAPAPQLDGAPVHPVHRTEFERPVARFLFEWELAGPQPAAPLVERDLVPYDTIDGRPALFGGFVNGVHKHDGYGVIPLQASGHDETTRLALVKVKLVWP